MKLEDLYKSYRDEAAQYASSYGIDMNSMEWDAFRHAYASASMASQYGTAVAELAGYAVELGGFLKGNSLESSNMDLWNNNVGREIGISATSKDEMAQQVFEALNMGKLITDEVNDPRNYFEDYPHDPFPDSQTTRPDFPNNHDFNDTDEGYDLGFTRPAPNSGVNDNWNDGKNWTPPRVDPLILDLDGDGIETLGVNATTHVVFDGNSDGLKTGTGWIAGDDGFLVLDRNGNGTIDNGGELFGDQTLVNGVKAANGLEALKAEDTNTDGVFDANDTNYTNVRVWQDTNNDGISQSSELHTLTELGIASINLTSSTSTTTTNGNTQTATGTFTRNDGTTGTAANMNFAQNPFYREFTDKLTLTDTALALPDMYGSGNAVNNLEFKNTRRMA